MGSSEEQKCVSLHQIRLRSDYNPAHNSDQPCVQSWSQTEMQARIAARVVAALPLATPLKGSPTATPRITDIHDNEAEVQRGFGSSEIHPSPTGADGPLLQQALSTGTAALSPDQFLTAEFADHAQQLTARLWPLAGSGSAGLSATAAMSNTTAYTEANPFSPPEDLAFSGHVSVCCITTTIVVTMLITHGYFAINIQAATSPSSPTRMERAAAEGFEWKGKEGECL